MIQPSIYREINIPIKMTCLKNQPPVVTMKRPVVEYAMPLGRYTVDTFNMLNKIKGIATNI